MKNSKDKKLIFLLVVIVLLFLIQATYLVYFQLFKSEELNKSSLNARNFADETKIERGKIFDINGKLLTETIETENGLHRKNTYSFMYSNIIGYNTIQYGKYGIEKSYNNELLDIRNNEDIFTRLSGMLKSQAKGNDLYLTINDKLQGYVYDLLGDNKGTVIVTKPKTGEIVTLVSKPSYNVNQIKIDWDEIMNSKDGILLNRATQGKYVPGSVFKLLTSTVFLRSGIDLNYNDTGEATIGGYTVHNFENKVYGDMDLEKALNVSANTYFFEKSKLVSNALYIKTLKDYGIGNGYNFPIPMSNSSFPFMEGLSDLEKANASFGQGDTLVTPMDMMLIAIGIANDGVVNQPYIVNKIVRDGKDEYTTQKVLSSNIEKDIALKLRKYMQSTGEYNGYQLNNGEYLTGKTGTAERNEEKNNAWYVGMTNEEKPEYAIVVMIENTEGMGGTLAAPIALKTIDFINENLK